MIKALQDIKEERERQVNQEGWTTEHDDEHTDGSLAKAAACYARSSPEVHMYNGPSIWTWPWDDKWWKPKNRRRDLVKAGALIVAEIERLDRIGGG